MSPLSQGYESTRMVPGCHSASQTSQHLSSHRFLNTQQSKVHQLSSLQPAQPKRMDPLLCHTVPQAVHLLPGLQCIWSRISMLGTLRTHNCEQNLTHANATQTCRHGFQGWNTPVITTTNKQWLLPQQFTPKSQPRTRMKGNNE
jgi:hypothetical protein